MLFLRQNPFLRFFLFFSLGILLSSYVFIKWVWLPATISIFVLQAIYLWYQQSYFVSYYRYRWVSGTLAASLLVVCGGFWAKWREAPVVPHEGNYRFVGVITDIIRVKDNSCSFNVAVDSLVSPAITITGPVYAVFYANGVSEKLDSLVGRTITGNGTLLPF